jgi:hypothetical protein
MKEQVNSMLSDNEWRVLEFLRSETAKEQEFYWARFSSFAALHAAIVVFYATTGEPRSTILAVFGLALAAAWVVIQYASRHYIARVSEPFHELRKRAGISYASKESIFNHGWTASTRVGLVVPLAMGLLWICLVVWSDHNKSPAPNNSFKPTPHRGSASVHTLR